MINSIRKISNPYNIFLPFLLLYVVFAAYSYSVSFIGDESRFVRFAENLLHGFYSPAPPNIDLLSGPGYPFILAPLVGLHLPKVYIVILNAIMHYLSIVFLFKGLIQLVSFRKTLIVSLFWACYYVAYQNMGRIAYEPLSMLLASIFIFCIISAFNNEAGKGTKKYVYLSGFILGYLALTKVIFGPIIVVLLMIGGLLWIINRKVVNFRKLALISVIAFATFAPYLVYTYSLTGRAFYWGTGADNIYWMSNPNEGEYGDWKGTLDQNPVENGNYNIPGAGDTLIARHKKNYDQIFALSGLERDDAYSRIAVENIKAHPGKYAQNIFYNIGRLLFHYPYSYAIQRPKSLFVMPMNGIILTFMLICLIPTLWNWRRISFPIRVLFFVALLYLGASSLVSSETRMFTLIVPVLLAWFAYIIQQTVKLDLKFKKDTTGNS